MHPGPGRDTWSPEPGIDVLRPSLYVPKRIGGLGVVGAQLRRGPLRDVDVLWVNDPDLGVHCLRSRQAAVYDVTDDWRTFQQAPRVLRRIVSAEDRLAVRARTCVCSAELATRWKERYGVDAAVVNNGIDGAAFLAAQPIPLDGEKPHVGYIGCSSPPTRGSGRSTSWARARWLRRTPSNWNEPACVSRDRSRPPKWPHG